MHQVKMRASRRIKKLEWDGPTEEGTITKKKKKSNRGSSTTSGSKWPE